MVSSNRYWDHEQCAWVVHDPAPAGSDLQNEAVPEQRADDAQEVGAPVS